MNQPKKKPINLRKAGRMTVLYMVVVTFILIILTPVYFLVMTSFLSTREAYSYPLPLFPSFTTHFSLRIGERGYLLSVKDPKTGEYETVLDTEDIDKMSVYMQAFLNTLMEEPQIQAYINALDNAVESRGGDGQDVVVYFSHRRDIFQNYQVFFRITREVGPALLRSLQIAFLTIIISLSIGGLAGYAFARYTFQGKNALKFSVLFVRMFPGVAIALPMIIILANMGLYDQPLGLSLVYSVGSIGLTVWITASIFMGIPVSLEEAALVFGASKLRAFCLQITSLHAHHAAAGIPRIGSQRHVCFPGSLERSRRSHFADPIQSHLCGRSLANPDRLFRANQFGGRRRYGSGNPRSYFYILHSPVYQSALGRNDNLEEIKLWQPSK